MTCTITTFFKLKSKKCKILEQKWFHFTQYSTHLLLQSVSNIIFDTLNLKRQLFSFCLMKNLHKMGKVRTKNHYSSHYFVFKAS